MKQDHNFVQYKLHMEEQGDDSKSDSSVERMKDSEEERRDGKSSATTSPSSEGCDAEQQAERIERKK